MISVTFPYLSVTIWLIESRDLLVQNMSLCTQRKVSLENHRIYLTIRKSCKYTAHVNYNWWWSLVKIFSIQPKKRATYPMRSSWGKPAK